MLTRRPLWPSKEVTVELLYPRDIELTSERSMTKLSLRKDIVDDFYGMLENRK